MREVKFRAWIDDNKEFAYLETDSGPYCGIFCGESESFDFGWVKECATIEQFTGLKDKKGTEIYEGDTWKETVIGWHCNGKAIKTICERWDIGVIGNIHENPEMLANGPPPMEEKS